MMKKEDNDMISAIPQGCYECGVQDDELQKGQELELSVDLQGNGYPIEKENE